jgi:hypothetical protein
MECQRHRRRTRKRGARHRKLHVAWLSGSRSQKIHALVQHHDGGKETSRMVPGGSLATTGHASREILSSMVAEQLPLRGAGRVGVLSPDVH